MSYSKKRYFVYTLLTLFIMLIPFITINDNHLLLLSFDKLQFHFLVIHLLNFMGYSNSSLQKYYSKNIYN